MKQRACEAAVEALRRLRDEASYSEMETGAALAVQPVIREYEHQQKYQRIVRQVQILGATPEEEEAAQRGGSEALVLLPIDAATRELEKSRDAAVVPFKAVVSERKKKARPESEKQTQRRAGGMEG